MVAANISLRGMGMGIVRSVHLQNSCQNMSVE